MARQSELTDAGPVATGAPDGLRLHTLVTALPAALSAPVSPQLQRIVQLCQQPLSIAEIAAALGVPVDRTRLLVQELLGDGRVRCDQLDDEHPPSEVIERIARRVRGM
jgi:Protein of unknown function (DUF742)